MSADAFEPGVAISSLSSDTAIQLILADVPLFAVGILAFGVLMFFFLMKRVDKLVFCLHLSVLVAFLAALFDLSQLLIRGKEAVDLGINTASVSGLITAREVFFAFSDGLRFLFYWGFVAAIPLGETIPENTVIHSGSWQRWGLLGKMLKWLTLLLVLLITIFQLVYRDVATLAKLGPIYETEATLEIIVSAVFILKLLLNTWARVPSGTTMPTKGAMLVQYAPMIVALLFSLWIAVGNAILYDFTETALGRFLRAIELYILIVYMLTVSFHHLRHLSFFPIYRPAPKALSRAGTFERNSIMKYNDEKVAAVASPPPAPEPVRVDFMQVLEERYRQQEEMPQTVMRDSSRAPTIENNSQHQSMAARLSTWLGIARPMPQQSQEVQPWDVDAERGPSPTTGRTPTWYTDEKPRMESPPLPPPPMIDEDEQRGVSPVPEYSPWPAMERDIASPAPSSLRDLPPAPGIIEPESEEEETTPVLERDWQDVEYSNAVRYSGVGEDTVANALSQQYYQPADTSKLQASDLLSPSYSRPGSMDGEYLGSPYPMSPIGSAAVTPLPRSRPLPPMPRPYSQMLEPGSPIQPDSARSSNMSILLRRQTELDASIAALRLYSPSKSVAFDVSAMPVAPEAFYNQLAQPSVSAERLSTVPSMESPELPAPSPDFTLATPRTNVFPQSSARSEFSFSNLPHVPPLNRGSMDSGVFPQMGIAVEAPSEADDDGFSRAESPMSSLAPPVMPAAMGSRFSADSSVAESRIRKNDSLGTQYEITSFIGSLSVPKSNKDSTISAFSAVYSDDGSVDDAVVSTAQFVRPTLAIPPPSQSEPSPASLAAPPQPSPLAASPVRTPSGGRRALPPVPQPAVQPQPRSPPAQPQPQPTQPAQAAAPIPAPRFRRAVGLPPRPRLSVVNLTPVEEKTSPTDTATLASPPSGSGTPPGRRW
ncbi:uncharacterized protein TRAVEDRAFT_62242 [Trametes versicolor FP-101664 SS1]|uniref:uncharacterized protein n=1 Tax=Trametes versicolor (strain FP-101664) TaxID=717944 RepID=UPI0004624353|nr:uncharacterized protein TRAVEDRAFT_62242 [Trametes versicolor FP-101664 SS1]EIW64800.1 hypothetical protein TRAVEDRAFT_62242 [Trametes versicolor FP-101664 SS1]